MKKLVFWCAVCVLFIWWTHEAFSQSAVEVYMESKNNQASGYYGSDDARQDSTVFWLCRELDSLRALILNNAEARREDDKELRAQIWKLALIVGGGSALGGAGGAAVVKRRKKVE